MSNDDAPTEYTTPRTIIAVRAHKHKEMIIASVGAWQSPTSAAPTTLLIGYDKASKKCHSIDPGTVQQVQLHWLHQSSVIISVC